MSSADMIGIICNRFVLSMFHSGINQFCHNFPNTINCDKWLNHMSTNIFVLKFSIVIFLSQNRHKTYYEYVHKNKYNNYFCTTFIIKFNVQQTTTQFKFQKNTMVCILNP